MSGDTHEVVLETLGITSHPARTDWAARKSRSLMLQRATIEAGDAPTEVISLADAIESYLTVNPLRPRTIEIYRCSLKKLQEWARKVGVVRLDQLTMPRLAAFRDHLASHPALVARAGGKRGDYTESGRKRSPGGVNKDLRTVKAFMNDQRRHGRTRLHRDDLCDALKCLRAERPRPRPLKPAKIKKLLAACRDHDADHPDHPVGPLVLFTLMTGCRIGEVLTLRWENVDLEEHEGKGEVVVDTTASKSAIERAVLLDVSPSVRTLLARLRLSSPGQYVFGGIQPLPRGWVADARGRLKKNYDAPTFNYQVLRQTCATFLTCSTGIYGAASPYLSARRLGHSFVVAERHYLGLVTVPREAKTLEQAMGVEELARTIATRRPQELEGREQAV